MEVMLTSNQSGCYASFGLALAATPSDLWHRSRNHHQTVCPLLLQGVILAGDLVLGSYLLLITSATTVLAQAVKKGDYLKQIA